MQLEDWRRARRFVISSPKHLNQLLICQFSFQSIPLTFFMIFWSKLMIQDSSNIFLRFTKHRNKLDLAKQRTNDAKWNETTHKHFAVSFMCLLLFISVGYENLNLSLALRLESPDAGKFVTTLSNLIEFYCEECFRKDFFLLLFSDTRDRWRKIQLKNCQTWFDIWFYFSFTVLSVFAQPHV